MNSSTPHRRRRLVIVDSPNSESSFGGSVTTSTQSFDHDADETHIMAPCNEVGNLVSSMNNVTVSENNSSETSRRRKCKRGGISCLDFESDDSDSSIEIIFTPVFKPKSTPIVLLDDSFYESSSDDSIQIIAASNTSKPRGKANLDGNKTAWTRSGDMYVLTSTPKTNNMPNLRIPSSLYDQLFDHQRSGVAWMAGLHTQKIGGLLGDDMGMGKTYMALTLVGGLMAAHSIRNALIVAPLSVLRSWETEAGKVVRQCLPKVNVEVVSSDIGKPTRCKRLRAALECSRGNPTIIITTYGLVTSSPMDFVHDRFSWDYVILDEAHKIKNQNAQVSKNVRRICRSEETRRLILTGTPIMNNLKELWALFDFATAGKVLGTLPRFNNRFATPIEDARSSNATSHVMRIGERANVELQEKIRPYFLQRLKIDFLADKLPKKGDFVVWTQLSEKQRSLYSTYVNSGHSAVAHVLTGISTSPLEAVTWLKKLCGHPILVEKGSLDSFERLDPNKLKEDSSKLQVLDGLVQRLTAQGHRILIFSQSTKMLDIIERVLHRFILSRIDGSTKEKDRQRRVDMFNNPNTSVDVMLLSTKAAGVGLTLTGADRAIIYDPSWNPAEDSQAVDRCYRIGQTKEVTVFRFITAGSVEEKMYEKQVHKDGIRRAVMTSMGSTTARYFDKEGLRKLFTLGPVGECEFLERLRDRGLASNENSPESRLTLHGGVIGVSSHDSVYSSKLVTIDAETNNEKENPFSSTPAPPRLPLSKTPTEKVETDKVAAAKVMGKSQRVLSKKRGKENLMQEKKKVEQVILNASSKARNIQRYSQPTEPEKEHNADPMRKIDNLRSSGSPVSALVMLMDLLENRYHDIAKGDKMEIHQRIASIAYELQWL